jgi:hypothetical protein
MKVLTMAPDGMVLDCMLWMNTKKKDQVNPAAGDPVMRKDLHMLTKENFNQWTDPQRLFNASVGKNHLNDSDSH